MKHAPKGRSKHNVNQNKSTRLMKVGNELLNSSDYYAGANIHQSQERISRLVEDRKRTMRQIDNDSAFDELDQLQVQVDEGYKTDLNKYRENVKNYSNGIRTDRDMDPEEKSRRLGNIRAKISSYDPNSSAPMINYQAAKPIMYKQIDKLNNIIKNEKQKETDRERRKVLTNLNMKVPNYNGFGNRANMFNDINKTDIKPKRNRLSHHSEVRTILIIRSKLQSCRRGRTVIDQLGLKEMI